MSFVIQNKLFLPDYVQESIYGTSLIINIWNISNKIKTEIYIDGYCLASRMSRFHHINDVPESTYDFALKLRQEFV